NIDPFPKNKKNMQSVNSSTIKIDYLEDFAEFLKDNNLKYKVVDHYYLQVGDPLNSQGWILHLSLIISQIEKALQTILPFLISEKIAFKIASDRDTCANMLLGYLGEAQIGKIIAVYTNSDIHALHIAKKLIKITQTFKGPKIPTDIHLGSIVYTRYESFNSHIQGHNGIEDKYILNSKKE